MKNYIYILLSISFQANLACSHSVYTFFTIICSELSIQLFFRSLWKLFAGLENHLDKMLALQAQGLQLDTQNPHEKSGMMTYYICNPNTGEMEKRQLLGTWCSVSLGYLGNRRVVNDTWGATSDLRTHTALHLWTSLPPDYLETRNEDFSEVNLENNEILGKRTLLFG